MTSLLFLSAALWLGFVLDEEFSLSRGDFLVRLAAAIVLGAFWATWIVFLLSWAFGFTTCTVLWATVLVLSGNLLAWRYRKRNWAWFATLFSFKKDFWCAAAVPTVLITLFFAFGIYSDPAGNIYFRGNSRDLAYHMATASAFLEQSAFPPLNPQSAGAKLSYHFMADFLPAILARGGIPLFQAFKIPMVLLAFSLCALTCHLLYSCLKGRIATMFAGFLFFFGHVGIVNVLFGLVGYPSGNGPLSLRSWSNIEDHVTYPYYNFQNVVIDYFQPQLPFLFAFPVAMLVLLSIFRKHTEPLPQDHSTYFLVALVAFLPLVHMHTFLTLCPLVGLAVCSERASRWVSAPPPFYSSASSSGPHRAAVPMRSTLVGSANQASAARGRVPRQVWIDLLAVLLAAFPVGLQLGYILSQPKTPGFSGFDVAAHLGSLPEIPDIPFLKRALFWIRAAGMPLVLGSMGAAWAIGSRLRRRTPNPRQETALLIGYLLTGLFFLVINWYRFTPNWGDSNKFFLYWDLALCIYAALGLAALWESGPVLRLCAGLLLSLGALLPTTIEWGMRFRREPERLFSSSDRLVADWIRLNTPGDAVFLTANSYVHLVPSLAGRRVVNGSYTRETGYADEATESLVARAYRESDPTLIANSKVTHIIVGPEEEGLYHINRSALGRRHRLVFDQACMGTRYAIYEVRDLPHEELARERAAEAARAFVWLSEIEPSSIAQFGILRYDRAFNLQALRLSGHTYGTGLGTHAPSEICFNLNGEYSRFESDIGLDSSQAGTIGSATFEVWLDERRVYQSNIKRGADAPESINIDISGATTLRLVVTDAGDNNHCDHADWADARLIKKK